MYILLNLFTDPIRRCRNEGGHDTSWCSSTEEFERDDNYVLKEIDPVCLQAKPKYRDCHISALNGVNVTFEFTPYSSFTHDAAVSVCEKIGGRLPNFEEELDAVWLQKSMEFLVSYVTVGWGFSMKWITWPVSNNIDFWPLY